MKKIYKYVLEVTDNQIIRMPKKAMILSAQFQEAYDKGTSGFPTENLCIWVLVDTEADSEEWEFKIFGTGHEVDFVSDIDAHNPEKFTFLDTVQQTFPHGNLVWHIFTRRIPGGQGGYTGGYKMADS